MRTRRIPVLALVLLAAVLVAPAVHTQSKVTPPQFTAGDGRDCRVTGAPRFRP